MELPFPLESLSSYKNQSDPYHRTGTEPWESALHAQQASWVSESTKISEEHNLKWDAYFLCGIAPWFIRSSVPKLFPLPIQHSEDSFLWGTQKTHSSPRIAGQGQAQGAMAHSTGEEKASVAKREAARNAAWMYPHQWAQTPSKFQERSKTVVFSLGFLSCARKWIGQITQIKQDLEHSVKETQIYRCTFRPRMRIFPAPDRVVWLQNL